MSQAVSVRLRTAEEQVRSKTSPCEICGGQNDTGTGFSPSTSVLLVSTIPPFTYMLLLPGQRRGLRTFK